MSVIIDRRPQQGKSAINRERFIRRYKTALKHQVDTLTRKRSIKDVDAPVEVEVQMLDVSEPRFVFSQGSGITTRIVPGNDRYNLGDRIPKEGGGRGKGNGKGEPGSGEGDEMDSFRFTLSREEFYALLFEGMELPELLRKDLTQVVEKRIRRAGFVRQGIPGNLSVSRTMQTALARRIALNGARRSQIANLSDALTVARQKEEPAEVERLAVELKELEERKLFIPYVDDIDLRYRGQVIKTEPRTAAVMFCLMDVSGSMDEVRKDLAKRFFTLLYLFLRKKYETIEVVFIRHTDEAEECDEDTFFMDPKSGSTVVLSALQKMQEAIAERYPPSQWNIFGAQCSDGDSFGDDPTQSYRYLKEQLLPLTRYFVYAETNEEQGKTSALWRAYTEAAGESFKMTRVHSQVDVYPALADLFKKEGSHA